MTDLLRQLYRNFGYLAALLTNINELHDTWASSSRRRHDSTADKLLTHNAPVAFVSAYYEWRVPGQDNSTEQIYGMCLVQAQSYFEGYLAELLRKMLRATPRMLLQNFDHDKRSTDHRNLDYRTIISAVERNESVIELMVVRSVRVAMNKPTSVQLRLLRKHFGFAGLTEEYDSPLEIFSLMRNCFVHNNGLVSAELEDVSRKMFTTGLHLHITKAISLRSLAVFRSAASAIDRIALTKLT